MKLTTTLLAAASVALGLGSTAYAADLIVDEPAYVAPVVSGGNWDGAYIGAFAGAGWGLADHTNGGGGPCGTDEEGCDTDLSGWLLGVTAGANFTVGGSFVLGVAGDIAWTDLSGSGDTPFDWSNSVNWEGSLRAVAGFDGGAFMPYVTAGVAFANASHTSEVDPSLEPDVTHVGWTAGVGVMFAVSDNVALDLQYRHSEYDEQEYDMDFAPFNPVYGLSTDRLTLGVNFMF
jgi:outer membrane immunogenic protein